MDFSKLGYFITIKDYTGKIILKNLIDTISNLEYTYSENEDDLCEIEVNSSDIFISDRVEFKAGQFLSVQWGYINGLISPIRKVYIFEKDTHYQKDGTIRLKLTCHERFAIAKMDNPANKNLEQLKDNSPIVFSTNAIKNIKLAMEKGNTELTQLIDNNNFNIGLTADDYLGKGKIVSHYSGNMSTYYTLRNLLDRLPGGPYVMDSRDDILLVRTRDFSVSSKKSYTWRGGTGELLDFKPVTKNRARKASSEKVTVASYDPSTKKSTTITSTSGKNNQTKLGEKNSINIYLVDALKAIQDKKRKPLPTFIPRSTDIVFGTDAMKKILDQEAYQNFKKNRDTKVDNLVTQIIKNKNNKSNPYNNFDKKDVDRGLVVRRGKDITGNILNELIIGTTNGVVVQGLQRDATAVAHNNGALVSDEALPGKTLHTNDTAEKAGALAENTRKNNELESNPGTAELLGQPELECGQIITILGVSNTHKGNYYISECQHKLSDYSYETHITKLVRDGINKVTTTSVKGKKKINLYDLIPGNPNLAPKTPTIILNNSKGPENNPSTGKKIISSKKPGQS